jgi:anaerobic magnesium-protoporphyrin IX monomethyl ester cyclase
MIFLINPRATKPRYRRFPLSVMALGAALPGSETWEIVDGNRPGLDVFDVVVQRAEAAESAGDRVRLLAFTVMPGPQLAAAVPLTKRLKESFPRVPVVWGGYFPSLYPMPVLAAPYVDWLVRGQGERTLLELLDVLGGRREPRSVPGLGWRENGSVRLNAERPWVGPDELPPPPYGRIDVEDYLEPTFLGHRSGVYQASIGCPYTCNFCGVIAAYGSRERFETPARTVENLSGLVSRHGMDGLHFYDNNFFQAEAHAREIAERMTPLGLRWWCEARIDVMLRFSDRTWERIRRSGCAMVYLGAESGSNATLAKMSKNLTTEQTLAFAAKAGEHGIVPEFSFMFGDPDDPEGEAEKTLAFIRRLSAVNPSIKLVTYFYTPTPQRRGTYGNIDPLDGTPGSLEEWIEPEWLGWMTHESPRVPWLKPELMARVTAFTGAAGAPTPPNMQEYGHLRPAGAL